MAHPDLNSIEMVWTKIKRSVQGKNINLNLNEVVRFTNEEFKNINSVEFSKYVEHDKKIEKQSIKSDTNLDEVLENFLKSVF